VDKCLCLKFGTDERNGRKIVRQNASTKHLNIQEFAHGDISQVRKKMCLKFVSLPGGIAII